MARTKQTSKLTAWRRLQVQRASLPSANAIYSARTTKPSKVSELEYTQPELTIHISISIPPPSVQFAV
jgi:hypothetical protein